MAALSHLKNKKESRLRDGIDKIMVKCGSSPGENISVKNYLDVMSAYNIELDKKEIAKINKLSGEGGYLDREEFIEYARKSGSIRDLTDRISSGGKSVGPSVNKPKVSLDKAELAFKAIDKDNSGSIDSSELSKLGGGNMSKEKVEKLMTKLDTDGDGKITLEEFRGLFKQMK